MPGAYLAAVLADAPRHYWRCADAGGLMLQDIGATPFPLAGVNGCRAGQLGYSGPNLQGGSVLVAADTYWQTVNILPANNRFTVEFFFWALGPYGSANQYFMGFSGDVLGSVWVALDANGAVQTAYNGAGGSEATTNRQGAWHHCAVSYDGATLRLYIDGTQQVTFAIASAASVTVPFYLGRRGGAGNIYVGFLSEMAWFDVALTAGRIATHFAAADNNLVRPTFQQSGEVSRVSGVDPLGGLGLGAVGSTTDSVVGFVSRTYQNTA